MAGTYYECAVLTQRDLVIEGAGAETVLTDRTCEDKAMLVARGDGLTVRDLVLARARVGDRNGAGIRLEGQGLVLERVRFENDEVGVLAGAGGPGTIVVRDCTFEHGGVAGERPTAALMVAEVGLLRVERSRFEAVKGAQVSSAALRTELVGNSVSTGVEPGAGPAVQASGALLMQGNTLALGPNAPPHGAAVIATGPSATLTGNRLQNGTGEAAVLLLDWTESAPTLADNVVQRGDEAVSSSGLLRHRAGSVAREAYGDARRAAGGAKRALLGMFGR